MNRLALRILGMAAGLAGNLAFGQVTIIWNSDANALNLTSVGPPMDGEFRFELGVFADGFVPGPGNVAEWATHWKTDAEREPYDAANQRYTGNHILSDNDGPITAGTPAYVWGFRGDGVSNEWILFRAESWIWPEVLPGPPSFEEWYTTDATAILGKINDSGCLMKSAAVANAAPPATTWESWKTDHLAGEPLDEPDDDPDHDGSPNLLEFVFGTSPTSANPPAATPFALVSGHLEITIPRRIDRLADLGVEVSGDLVNWFSGPSHTMVLADSPAALVVRDLTTHDAAHPRRFMRLRAALPGP